ncbi:MAG: S16 family serine protease [Bacillota bacterium]|nr:S16 family serine protease [Bacillota bacterium]
MKYQKYFGTALAAVMLVVLGFVIRIDYFLVMPSRAVELGGIIAVENGDPDDEGSFYLVTVSQKRASLITALYGKVHPYIDITPMESVIPSNMDESEYRQLLIENMVESRHLAQVVALRRTGYEVEIMSDGVEIVGLSDDAPAEGFLFEGDIILSVDDIPVFLATEVPLMVQDRQVGSEVTLALSRGGQELSVSLPTGASPDDEEMPFLGIFIKTLPWEPVLPINIYMDTGRIGGPSAGLMFVLEIMNQLDPEDITGGKSIAGTGTIDINGNVGRIGGVVQKVVAADRVGAEYFLVPQGNYELAKSVGRGITLVPVENLDEVLEFLRTLN